MEEIKLTEIKLERNQKANVHWEIEFTEDLEPVRISRKCVLEEVSE